MCRPGSPQCVCIDLPHAPGCSYFTWAGDKFPHPQEMVGNLVSRGRKLVTIVDPHLKKDDNYKVYADLKAQDYYVKNKDSGEYEGWCWPGKLQCQCRPSQFWHSSCGYFIHVTLLVWSQWLKGNCHCLQMYHSSVYRCVWHMSVGPTSASGYVCLIMRFLCLRVLSLARLLQPCSTGMVGWQVCLHRIPWLIQRCFCVERYERTISLQWPWDYIPEGCETPWWLGKPWCPQPVWLPRGESLKCTHRFFGSVAPVGEVVSELASDILIELLYFSAQSYMGWTVKEIWQSPPTLPVDQGFLLRIAEIWWGLATHWCYTYQ